jgi:hypothetical protein
VSEPGDVVPEGSVDARAAAVATAVASWTRHLVDLGGRNTLLWYRDLPTGTLDLSTAHPGGIALLMTGRPTKLSDIVREPAAFEEARRRVRAIAGKARELKEERGIETCFVAFGMATWDLGASTRPPAAPVLLRAVTLRAVGVGGTDYVLDLTPVIEFNPVLEHYLRTERGIEIDSDALEALAVAGSGFDPYPVYADLSERCLGVPGFAVTPRVTVGTFSYAKLPLVADLAGQGVALADHDVVAALAGDPDALASVRSDLPVRGGDPVLDDLGAALVLDADSSQQEVIEAARAGAHLVVQGPPGTGKSQTITNLLAALAADGKRVLFVAEKRAAIEAVVGRLEDVGLGSIVLDLHDGARAKHWVGARLGQDLDALREAPLPTIDEGPVRAQQESAATLDAHFDAMHATRAPWGVSAHEVMSAVSALSRRPRPPRSRIRLRGEHLAGLSVQTRDATATEIGRLASLGAWRVDGGDDPWFGAALSTADDAVAARDRVERLNGGGLDDLERVLRDVLSGLRFPEVRTVGDWGRTLTTLAKVRDTLEVFRAEVFDAPLDEAVAASASKAERAAAGTRLGWWERRRILKAARRLLRPGPQPADLHAVLVDASNQRAAWRDLAGPGGRPEIPADLDRARAAHAAVMADLAWLDERLAPREGGRGLADLDREDLATTLAALAATPERLAVVPTVRAPLDDLAARGWQPLVDDLAERSVAPEDVPAEVEHVWWTSVAEEIAVRDSRIGGHSGDHLRLELDRFVEADRAVIAGGAERVRGAVTARAREVVRQYPEQAAFLGASGARRRGRQPVRDLLPMASDVMTALRPCWVMSPLVVASVLPPGRWFDVVVFDEASQVPPAEAVSAISRARQVVLAGDSHQLPPTSFFTTVTDDVAAVGQGPLTDGVESILDVLSAALPMRRLRWHYRSLDERLIAFSNHQVYDGDLVTFPGAGEDPALVLESVDGQGMVDEASAAVESTRAEVDRVVQLVLEHARRRPHESLGVVTLGLVHAQRIEDALTAALAGVDDETAAFFEEGATTPFFVKNLERVQGDERDAIILSVGYGKTPHGRVLHRFGPLNIAGGERRLNVAVTRARRRMTVVSSLRAADLDPARLKATGALMLRDFLAYAESGGSLPGSGPDGAAPKAATPPLHRELADRLRDQGLVVHHDVGTSRTRIDLAVEDPLQPGRLALAISTDGPNAAAIPSSRDRDRLRDEQLRRLGWRTLRVWTTDIYRDPARDVERIRACAEGAPAPPTAPTEGADAS